MFQFHDVVEHRQQKNVQKSCCFANLNVVLFAVLVAVEHRLRCLSSPSNGEIREWQNGEQGNKNMKKAPFSSSVKIHYFKIHVDFYPSVQRALT